VKFLEDRSRFKSAARTRLATDNIRCETSMCVAHLHRLAIDGKVPAIGSIPLAKALEGIVIDRVRAPAAAATAAAR
jgi:hypothetical protein